MAKVYISEYVTAPIGNNGQLLAAGAEPSSTTQNVAIGGTSTQSSAFGTTTKFIRVHTDAICSFAIGANPTATANSARLAANSTEYFGVTPGQIIAIITNT